MIWPYILKNTTDYFIPALLRLSIKTSDTISHCKGGTSREYFVKWRNAFSCSSNLDIYICSFHVYVVIHFSDSVWFCRLKGNLYDFFLLFLYIFFDVGNLIIKEGRVEIPITLNGLHQPHFCACPNQDLDIQHHISLSFLCPMIWDERWLFVLLILVEFKTCPNI